jgi:hypothetical protein
MWKTERSSESTMRVILSGGAGIGTIAVAAHLPLSTKSAVDQRKAIPSNKKQKDEVDNAARILIHIGLDHDSQSISHSKEIQVIVPLCKLIVIATSPGKGNPRSFRSKSQFLETVVSSLDCPARTVTQADDSAMVISHAMLL